MLEYLINTELSRDMWTFKFSLLQKVQAFVNRILQKGWIVFHVGTLKTSRKTTQIMKEHIGL